MRGGAFSAIYIINIVVESIFTMLVSVGLFVLTGWLLVSRAGLAEWIYVPLILIGIAVGFVSMYRLISASMRALERIEKDRTNGSESKDSDGGI